jgi:riboflavin synthase
VFTGIIEEIGAVAAIPPVKLVVKATQVVRGMTLGQSIALNGACLTVTAFDAGSFAVDVMPETLQRTNLGRLSPGDDVNLERPLALGGQLGGHLVQGHVDATGRVAAIEPVGEALLVRIQSPPEVMRYVVEKGFIAVDGISLTVTSQDATSFQVSVVDFTRQHTNLGARRIGDLVNLEVDIIAKYVEQFIRARNSGITMDFLREHGFAGT